MWVVKRVMCLAVAACSIDAIPSTHKGSSGLIRTHQAVSVAVFLSDSDRTLDQTLRLTED